MTEKEKEKEKNQEKREEKEKGEGGERASAPGGASGEGVKEDAGTRTYICITCDRTFEVERGEKARCPTCLSIHSVEPYERKRLHISKQNIRLAVILGGLIVVAAAVYLIMDLKYKKDHGGQAPAYAYTHEQLLKALQEKGIAKEDVYDPFQPGELGGFVDKALSGVSSSEKGEKLFKAFMDMKGKGGFLPFVPRQPRPSEPMKAGQVLAAMKKNEKVLLYSLELATLVVVAARQAGLNALVAKIDDYKDMKAPLDPSGNVGHFAAALYKDDDFKGKPTLIDLHQGKIFPADAALFTPLSDVQVAASYMGLQAFYLSGVKFDSTKGLSKVEDGISLFPSSAELYSLKGLIYIASGGVEEGKQQIRKAMTIKKDAPRILKWGAILMAEGEEDEAVEQIKQSIDLKPRYAMAHATLAMAFLSLGETDEARKELDTARDIDPNDPLIPLYEANYYLERGQITEAIEQAERAYEKSYGDPQVGILLASLYDKAGRKSKLVALLDKIFQNENLPAELKQILQQKFDYEPGSGEEEDEEEEEGLALDLGGGLQKKGGLLGGKPSLGKPSPGGGEEEEEEVGGEGDAFKLKLGQQKGGLLTGKGSGLDLQIH
jgi:Tfp pilus assembly protein PilF